MTGERLSHFKLEYEIFKDYAGSVYQAKDASDDSAVTLRVIPTSIFESERDKQQFVKDMIAISAVAHPNVAAVYGVEEVEDYVLVSSEKFAEARNGVGDAIPAIADTVGWLSGLLAGLEAAYERGVIHGGLCPRVVSRTAGGSLKVFWFGLGRFINATSVLTHTTYDLACMAPEAIQGREIDERADLWSVGVILYEWLCGFPPFRGEDPASLVHEVFNAVPPNPGGDRGGEERALVRLSNRLLSKNPNERPKSIGDVVRLFKTKGSEEPNSLMVLYFACTGIEADKSYVSTGLTENLISRLSLVDELLLASKHDSLSCRGRDVDPRELGRCMGVGHVLQGTVWTSGDKLRVNVQIIDVATGFETWSSQLDRRLDDVLELQSSIASKVVDALQIRVSDVEREALSKDPTSDSVAYDFYMRGREYMSIGGKQNTEAAIRMHEFAVVRDPSFALAHASLAEAYSDMYTYYDGSETWLDRVWEEGSRALDLDSGLTIARFNIGVVCFHRKQYTEARETFEKIVSERPRCYEAYRWLGIVSDVTGDFDTALVHYKKSSEIKPCSVEPWLYINMTHRRRGDVAAANEAAKRFLEVGLKTLQIIPNDPVTLSRFCVIYTLFGDREKAYDALGRVLESDPEDGLVLYNCAATYSLLGDEQKAIECLEKALSRGYKNVREWIVGDPDFDGTRDSEAFRKLLTEFDLQHGS